LRRKTNIPHRLLTASVGALVALALVPGWGAAANNPLSEVTDGLGDALRGTNDRAATAEQAPSAPGGSGGGGGGESPTPSGDDHASGAVADVRAEENEIVTVGRTDGSMADDGSSSSDVTVLAIGGQEIAGAHSDSEEGPENETHDPLAPVCEGSGGAICLGLLYADASSSEDANSSRSSGSAAVAFACLGGTQTDASQDCDGAVSAEIARSDSEIARDKESGETEATHSNTLADVCAGGVDASGTCTGAGAEAGHSESQSESGPPGGQGSTERSSLLANGEVNGESNEIGGDPSSVAVPPDCPETSVACASFNEGESFVFTGGAAGQQQGARASIGPDVAVANLSDSETLATNAAEDDGPTDVVEGEPPLEAPDDTVLGAAPLGPGSDSALPFTGVALLLYLAIALGLVSAGAWLIAFHRCKVQPGR
jgi:hypothetical protein